jgi:hypothetical protein
MIHVALASTYATEAEARVALGDKANYAPDYARFAASSAPYLGIWRMPEPYGAVVHVFADIASEELEAIGWIRGAIPDCLCAGEIPHPERGMQPGAGAAHHARLAEEA